jgi:hypothetical protein
MASPDKIKIGAYLTASENEALKRVADSLGVSASKAVAMAIKALDEKIQRGNKVSLPVAVNTGDKVDIPPDIQLIVNESVKTAIAGLLTKTEFESEKEDIWAELTRLDSSVAMAGNYYQFTGNEDGGAAPVDYFPDGEEAIADPKSQPLN